MHIETVFDFNKALSQGPYVWPGGYPCYFVCSDGEALSFSAAIENQDEIRNAIINNDNTGGWKVIGLDINYEDNSLYCAHSGIRIESAYEE